MKVDVKYEGSIIGTADIDEDYNESLNNVTLYLNKQKLSVDLLKKLTYDLSEKAYSRYYD